MKRRRGNASSKMLIDFQIVLPYPYVMSKLKMWKNGSSWQEAESSWDQRASNAAKEHPIKKLSQLPDMPGITHETAKNLKWKSLKWMLLKDKGAVVLKKLLKHPLKYTWKLALSMAKKKSFKRNGDFFLYGVKTVEEFGDLLLQKNTIFVIGFSYCHKPFECPSGRFTDKCVSDLDNPVCQQCFIGKCVHALPENDALPIFIPTVHYIGSKMIDIVHANPEKKVVFLITACEMTLEMFGNYGNMIGIEGVGVRLDGRICNTMKAFELSENGIKPGLTVVLEPTKQRILSLIRLRRESFSEGLHNDTTV